uniref:Beta-glucosidase n=1 Tax=Gossypium raimondii TaxID=29730 RepID=A0A0D2W6U5_GOSRA|nr:hypothetical protein B456_013G167400 [Gossypium raimondii]
MPVNDIIHVSLMFFVVYLLVSSTSNAEGFEIESQDVRRFEFPDNFLFGTAVSSYQVEGGYLEDGKGLSNWDVFTHIPGNIKNNENGDDADDDYHLFLEDAEIAQSLGVNAYRFSISWARILPRGRFGEVNPGGIKFYNKIIDNLLLREMSYVRGLYPPAHCSPPFGNCSVGNADIEPLIVVHNMLLAHGKAVKLYRERFQSKQGGSIGLVVQSHMYEPLRDVESDRQAVNRALAFTGGWVLDPLVFGDYPPEMRQYHRSELPRFSSEETEYMKGSIDFIGLNHYSTLYAKDCIHSPCVLGGDHFIRGFTFTTGERDGTLIGEPTGVERFYVVPRGMEKIVDHVSKRYNNMPIYVTENGYCPPLTEAAPNLLHDVNRVHFYNGYLAALARAIRKGADVRGYFAWSLMDNFEWAGGYSSTFGLYYVDRLTMNRTPKLSAKWFQHFLANRSSARFNRQRFVNPTPKSRRVRKSKYIVIATTNANATDV